MVPVMVGVLGINPPKQLASYMALLDISHSVETIHKTVILGMAQTLRKV